VGDRTVERLAAYAAHLRFEDLPAEVVHQAKRVLIDSVGCALGAFTSATATMAREAAAGVHGAAEATLLGTVLRTTPDLAAFANGVAVRYLDFNDAYVGSHPSDNFPVVLAAAEAAGASGRDLLTGCVLAYDVQGAWTDTFNLRDTVWDQAVYAAAAMPLGAGKVMGLSEAQLAEALRISVVSGMALNQTRRGSLSHWKAAAVPNAGRNAVFAALLARRGFTGPDEVFQGVQGFFAGITRQPVELEPLAGEDGNAQPFRILESRVKRFPSGILSQTAIEAALEARARLGVSDGRDIRAVRIRTSEQAIFSMAGHPSRWRPETRETADHSLPFVVACALQLGSVTPAHFTEERLRSVEMVDLMEKVTVEPDPKCTAAWRDTSPSIVTVELADGRRHTARVDHHLGHARRPVGDADVDAKFRGLAEGLLGDEQQTAALGALWRIEEADDLRSVLTLLEVGELRS
jgi:2-methylcitrate dehydratase